MSRLLDAVKRDREARRKEAAARGGMERARDDIRKWRDRTEQAAFRLDPLPPGALAGLADAGRRLRRAEDAYGRILAFERPAAERELDDAIAAAEAAEAAEAAGAEAAV